MATQTECQHKFYISEDDEILNAARFKAFSKAKGLKVGDKVEFYLINTCCICKIQGKELHLVTKKK